MSNQDFGTVHILRDIIISKTYHPHKIQENWLVIYLLESLVIHLFVCLNVVYMLVHFHYRDEE